MVEVARTPRSLEKPLQSRPSVNHQKASRLPHPATLALAVAVALFLGQGSPVPAAPLQERLEQKRNEFLKSAPAEMVASYQAGIDSVAASGIYERALKTGAKVPDFTLKNAAGEATQLRELLKKGPVVLTWYRGG